MTMATIRLNGLKIDSFNARFISANFQHTHHDSCEDSLLLILKIRAEDNKDSFTFFVDINDAPQLLKEVAEAIKEWQEDVGESDTA
jgi:hypothetical protein